MTNIKILFVCMGNICRSPCARGVFSRLVASARLMNSVTVDSAGTSSLQVGQPVDERMREVARGFGYDLDGVARQIAEPDFHHFDLIFAMDSFTFGEVCRQAPDPLLRGKVRPFSSLLSGSPETQILDPYLGGRKEFEEAMRLIEKGCGQLLAQITEQLGSGN